MQIEPCTAGTGQGPFVFIPPHVGPHHENPHRRFVVDAAQSPVVPPQMQGSQIQLGLWAKIDVAEPIGCAHKNERPGTDQQLRRGVELNLRSKRIPQVLQRMSEHNRSEFPPHWSSPPHVALPDHTPVIAECRHTHQPTRSDHTDPRPITAPRDSSVAGNGLGGIGPEWDSGPRCFRLSR